MSNKYSWFEMGPPIIGTGLVVALVAVCVAALEDNNSRLDHAVKASQLMAGTIWENAGRPPHGICLRVVTGEVTRRNGDDAPCPEWAMLIRPHDDRVGFLIVNP